MSVRRARPSAHRPRRSARGGPGRPGVLALALYGAFGAAPAPDARAAGPLLPGTVVGRQVWSGAAIAGGNGTSELVIRQSLPRAQLHWDRFDVDRGQTVRFDQQGNRNWVALNWIADSRPSEIAGRLVADGQVYLINQNGIVFRPGAQVDAASFIASTLSLQTDAFVRGLTALRDGRATFEMAAGASPDARIEVQNGPVRTLSGQPVLGPDGQQLVEAARITSQDGGRVFLFATREVVNAGLITSPGGQIVLAAGRKVYLFAPRSDDSAAFRGLFVEVGSGGEARNLGTLISDRGNVSLVGMAVNQSGRVRANSALSGNGSVWLLARSDLPDSFDLDAGRPLPTRAGTVTLGARSTIELPARSETDANGQPLTAIDAQQAFPSQVRIEGRRVALEGDGTTGAAIVAPAGVVAITATAAPVDPAVVAPVGPSADGRIFVDAGARIDVSGVRDVQVPVARNLLEVELRGENLGDSTALRSPTLAGESLRVDLRNPGALFSQQTIDRLAQQQIGRTVEERSTGGGTIRLVADGDVIVNPGATLDLSGGWVRYLPGRLETSTLFDGLRTIEVSQATPDRSYQRADAYAITDPRWGVTRSWGFGYRGRVDPGYLEGQPAGQLELNAPALAMAGSVAGSTVTGSRQRGAPPAGALVSFGNRYAFQQRDPDFRLTAPVRFDTAPIAIRRREDEDPEAIAGPANAPLPLVVDAAALAARGVARIEVFTEADVAIAPGHRVELPAGGRLTIAAGGGVAVRGDIVVPGARDGVVQRVDGRDVTSRGIDLSGVLTLGATVETSTRTRDVVVDGARISAGGQWIVDSGVPAAELPAAAAVVDSGNVRLASPTAILVTADAAVDASSGARLSASQALVSGAAGRIELLSTDAGSRDRAAQGLVSVRGGLAATGFNSGGSLRIDAADIDIGSVSTGPTTFSVTPSLFRTGGFAEFDLRAANELRVLPGTVLRPVQLNRQFDPAGARPVDADGLRAAAPVVLRADEQRRAASVALRATSPYRGLLTVGADADVAVEPTGRITLESAYRLDLLGRVAAPAGQVSAAVGRLPGSAADFRGFRGTQGLYVGSGAEVSVDGVDATWRDQAGRINGGVLAGGQIAMDAWDGYLVVERGARFSAQGARGIIASPGITGPDDGARLREVGSDAGRIRFSATNGGAIAAHVGLAAGSPAALPGELLVAVSAAQAASTGEFDPVPAGAQTTAIVDAATAVPAGAARGMDLDRLVNGPVPTSAGGWADRPTRLAIARETLAGDVMPGRIAIEARDRIEFAGSTTLAAVRSVTLDAPAIAARAVSPSDAAPTVRLRAPYVAVGNSRAAAPAAAATAGTATLDVESTLATDLVGTFALQGIGLARVASAGDLRGVGAYLPGSDAVAPFADGRMSVAGAIELNADRLYPTTFSRYSIEAEGPSGSIITTAPASSGPPETPLSAGGRLAMRAGSIDHRGRAWAPQGAIELDAAATLKLGEGALLSVSGGSQPVPIGETQDGRSIVYPFTATNARPVTELPRSITLAGASVAVLPGAIVDASGGGEAFASSFVAGSRGTADLLLRPNVFAVLPALGGPMPSDFVAQREMLAARDAGNAGRLAPFRGALPATVGTGIAAAVGVGDRVWLSGSEALPEGAYTLLPARYALSPGAVLVVATTARDFVPARNSTLADGSALVAGWRFAAGSDRRDERWSAFNVLPRDVLRQYGEYVTDTAGRFFPANAQRTGGPAPRVPADAGTVTIAARGPGLDLRGDIRLAGGTSVPASAFDPQASTATTPGRAGAFELAGERIAIAGDGGAAPVGFVAVPADRLRALGAERLLLGGGSVEGGTVDADGATTRTRTVTPVARELRIERDVVLTAQEIGLAATESIVVDERARIVSTVGGVGPAPERIDADGGAWLGLSGNGGQTLLAADPGASTAKVTVAPGVVLEAARIGIAAPAGAGIAPDASLRTGHLEVDSNRIVVGGPAAVDPTATVLSDALLASLAAGEGVTLHARDAIRLHGGSRLGGPDLGRISIDAANLFRTGPDEDVALRAARIEIRANRAAVDAPAAPDPGAATLDIVAGAGATGGTVILGEGNRAIAGFGTVSIASGAPTASAATGGAIRLAGEGRLDVAGNLTLTGTALVAGPATTQAIAASGALRTVAAGPADTAGASAAGARVTLGAASVDHGGAIRLPSGVLRVEATGPDAGNEAALRLRSGSAIDLAGARAEVAGVSVGASAGMATLVSRAGTLVAESGATIDVSSAAESTVAGTLRLEAPAGRVDSAATLRGAGPADGDGGRLLVDAGSVAAVSALAAAATAGGFDRELSVRSRSGALDLVSAPGAAPIRARRVTLSSDAGPITLDGTVIDASGGVGGRIELHAAGRVALGGGAALLVRGNVGQGGDVLLDGRQGAVIAPGSRIDAAGATGGGSIDFRIPQALLTTPGVLAAPPGALDGAGTVTVTGVIEYTGIATVTQSTRGSATLALTDAFAVAAGVTTPANLAAAASSLGQAGNPAFRLRPEIDVRSGPVSGGGALTVQQNLDLSTTRFTSVATGDTAGVLSLRAEGDLRLMGATGGSATTVTAVLNDGFGGVAGGQNNTPDAAYMGNATATWSYRLVGGVDPTAADPGTTRAADDPALGGDRGNVALRVGRGVRTGTGAIEIAAARDIRLGVAAATDPQPVEQGAASVFTAGRAAPAVAGFVTPTTPGVTLRPAYATDGGDVTLRAGGSILAAESNALVSNWLFRSGEIRADGTLARAGSGVSWWPEFRYFTQSVGALGGGDVRVEAGADLRNLSVAIASTGRLTGNDTSQGQLVLTGGGNLEVTAAGAIDSGSFVLMRGAGRVVAGEGLGSARDLGGQPVHPLVALGDARLTIEARRGLTVDQIYNPTLAPQRIENARTSARRTHFSSYGDSAELSLVSLAGDVEIAQSGGRLADAAGFPINGYNDRDVPFNLAPGRLTVRALTGDFRLRSATADGSDVPNLLLAPSPEGQLDLFAAGSILGSGFLTQSDSDPVLGFGPRQPFADVLVRSSEFGPAAHALVPVHRDDPVGSRIVAGRDIAVDPRAATQDFVLTVAEAAEIRAGRDVANLSLSVQNTRVSDVSRIEAGRDIVNETRTTGLGQLNVFDSRGVVVTGPGRVDLRAARDVAMGTSRGIVTRGNLENPALPDRGASIVLVAGLPDDPAYDAFLDAFVKPGTPGRIRDYATALIDFVGAATGLVGLDAQGAWTALQTLAPERRSELARSVFFLELRDAGRAASDPANARYRDFQPAYDAMAAMFPRDGAGNVDLVFSQVKTERGGDVRMLVPGVVCRGPASACDAASASPAAGNVFVGLTSPPPELTQGNPPPRGASQLGIFTLQGGDIQAAVGGDLAVNRSRILTVAGGGITLFSALGDIDAGRGSKSATSAPPPLVRVDRDGNVVVELPGVVEGSGIGVLVTQPGVVPGDVDLFAPKGVIDAGEAGIRAAGNITVFATQVLNAANISVGGASTGVPAVASAPNLSLASSSTSSAGAGSAARAASEQIERAAGDAAQRTTSTQRLLVLEFLGFGDEGEEAWRRRRGRDR